MLRTKTIDDGLRRARLDAKTRDQLFRRRIEQGANCALFVSEAILQTVKDLFPFDADDPLQQLDLGRIKLLVVAAHEPPASRSRNARRSPSCSRSVPVATTSSYVVSRESPLYAAHASCAWPSKPARKADS